MEEVKKNSKILIVWWLWYIGSHTAVVFGQAWYDIIIIDNMSNSYMEVLWGIAELIGKQPEFYDVDIRDNKAIQKLMKENTDIEWVLHFAAKKSISESCQDPFLYYRNNIQWSINLYKAMLENDVKNIVYSSSWTVYDAQNILPPFTETDNVNATNPYSTTVLVNELLLKDLSLHKKLNVINLRYFNPIGAHFSWVLWENPKWVPSMLVPYIFKVAKNEIEQLKIFWDDYKTKDWTWVRDYVHIVDVAEAHLLAYEYMKEFIKYKAESELTVGKWLYDDFNIWTSEWLSVKDMIALVEKVIDKKIPYKVVWRRPWDVDEIIANSQKAKQILWWTPKRSTYQAIEDWWRYVNKSI